MIKKLLFVFVGMLLISTSIAQTGERNNPVVGKSETVKENPVLKDLSEKVNLTYQEFTNSSTATRTSVSTAKNNYVQALDNYLTELEKQITVADEQTRVELEKELNHVKQLKQETTTTTTR